ncbi:hypothetical protein CERZMDRAFT_118192 [Cercospora zeae-maydis SCOH1-5]|uniref:BTB domain-containing protein n=1 Tax=Cercospora zeae-maydis SCOH1-5 TaxID=717836 RepID=A0A6A6FAI7_9PEZI|nr:hypothetical protein CERZMDRAFT_118192 [Cercospora zeae-maydis SCOH1-5]
MAMSDPSSTVLGKRKAPHVSPTTPRKRFSAAELYNPTMVTIVVSEAGVMGNYEDAASEEFVLQRGLICSHSKYFESAFHKQWSESQSKRLQIDDVSPKIFRIFVAWLFYQQIFYDQDRVEPDAIAPNASEQLGTSTSEQLNTSTRHRALSEGCTTSASSSYRAACASTTTSLELRDRNSDVQAAKRSLQPPALSHIDPYDPQNALTWPWTDLFELYVFAEKYDTRGLRIKVFDLIQLRLVRNAMLYESRWLPDPDDVTYLVENLPSNSRLVMLLSRYYQVQSARPVERRLAKLGRLPSSFLALCYLHSMRFMQAKHCPTCQARQHHTHDRAHTWEDTLPPHAINSCLHHEHGDDQEERAECLERWSVKIQALRDELSQKAQTVAASQEIVVVS